jgi:hypothetical protein
MSSMNDDLIGRLQAVMNLCPAAEQVLKDACQTLEYHAARPGHACRPSKCGCSGS